MIPRITCRDADDALIIVDALQLWMVTRLDETAAEARQAGADGFALSMRNIEETRNICDMIDSIQTGIVDENTHPEGSPE